MWSDNDIDNAFQRLNPAEPEPVPFPLDAWLRLETQLDQAVIERAVRHRLWRFFAAEVAVVALVALGWLLWPTAPATPAAADALPKTTRQTTTSEIRVPSSHTPAAGAGAVADAPARPAAVPMKPVPTAASGMPAAGWHSSASATEPGVARSGRALSSRPKTAAMMAPGPLEAGRAMAFSARTTKRRAARDTGNNRAAVAVNAASVAVNVRKAAKAKEHFRSADLPKAATISEAQPGLVAAEQQPSGYHFEVSSTADDAAVSSPTIETDWMALTARRVALLAMPTSLPATLAPVATEEPKMPVVLRAPRLYVGLVGAPDVTTVKFAGVESPLPNVGLTLEYRITQRLRVNTGLLRSNKKYEARRDDYDWGAYRQAVYQRDFAEVYGTCTVLDVPLNLRYDLLSRPQYAVFSSVGLSSFLMLRERYTYDYVENNVLKVWPIEATNQNRHLLSILNLSAGYERRLSARWRLQAEPYLKIPLAGVGLGKVRLTSAGVFVGVKYGF